MVSGGSYAPYPGLHNELSGLKVTEWMSGVVVFAHNEEALSKLRPIEPFSRIVPLSVHRSGVATSTQEAYLVLRAQCGDREALEQL